MTVYDENAWRTVPGFDDYLISETGEIRKINGWVLMKTHKSGESTEAVLLSRDGRRHHRSVEVLRSLAWPTTDRRGYLKPEYRQFRGFFGG